MDSEVKIETEQIEVLFPKDGIKFPVQVMWPLKPGRFPLMMISHGNGGSYVGYRSLAGFLARSGYVVAALEHPLNNRNDNSREDTVENLRDRPEHLRLAIDAVLANSRVAGDQIAVVGHSLGAYTALALAGGVAQTKHQMDHDPRTKIKDAQEISVLKDHRIKALVLLAPAAVWFASENSLNQVDLPILIMTGEKDQITPEFHADVVKGRVPDESKVRHRIVKKAGHFSFMSPFPKGMQKPSFPPAMDPPGFDREKFQAEEMHPEILKFLNEVLRPLS